MSLDYFSLEVDSVIYMAGRLVKSILAPWGQRPEKGQNPAWGHSEHLLSTLCIISIFKGKATMQVGRESYIEAGMTCNSQFTMMKKIAGRVDSCLKNSS